MRELCDCWPTEWHQEVYADGANKCKHCGLLMPKFASVN